MYSMTLKTNRTNLNDLFSVCDLKCDVKKIENDIVEVDLNSFKEDDYDARLEVLNTLLKINDKLGSEQFELISI